MEFGLFGGAQAQPGEVITEAALGYHEFGDYVVEAERLGYRSAWLVEHHFTGFAQLSATLTYLTYLATRTSTIRLGTAVTVVPWHNPVLLAEQAAMVDVLSRGRFDFGVGKGYRYNEFHGFGMELADAGSMFEEAMTIIRRGWTEPDRWSYKSDRWEFNDVIVEPPTIQKPHPPLWRGVGSEGSIREAARDGYNILLNQMSPFDKIGEAVAVYREEIERSGKTYDPKSIGVTRGLMVANDDRQRGEVHEIRRRFISEVQVLTRDPKLAARAFNPVAGNAHEISENGAIIGSSDEMVERIGKLQDVGVVNVLLHDLSGSTEALQQFAAEVMPHFSETKTVPPDGPGLLGETEGAQVGR